MIGILAIILVYLTFCIGCTIQANTQPINPIQIESLPEIKNKLDQNIKEIGTGADIEQKDRKNNSEATKVQDENTDTSPKDVNDLESISIPEKKEDKEPIPDLPMQDEMVTITVNAAGDCTLGTDTSFGYSGSFPDVVKKNGYEYIFRNVKNIFGSDDLTIVNLETTLTDSTKKAVKQFRFKGSPEYTKILNEGSIEVVNIANNHIRDYLDKGYSDTINSLKQSNIGYFGYGNKYITEIKGIKVGCVGYEGWNSSSSIKKVIKDDIDFLKKSGVKLIIVSFHWGEERKYYPNSTQKDLGKYAIDCGADLVLGHHPHVIQGIKTYKDKNIVYSLGNFAFGGNRNPSDKDTFIYQQVFEFKNGKLLNTLKTDIIPCSVSSVKTRNNYQPTPLEEKDAINVLNRIFKYSDNLN
jgi:hypothetical protein